MTKHVENALSWVQINNWVPIITSAVLIALSWASLNTQIQLLNQGQQQIIATQKEMIENQKLYLNDLNALHGRLVEVETKLEIR